MEAENNSSDDSNHDSRSRKRKRSGGTEKALDRISSLPSPILVHILSLLPTKHAARTSVLSKQWQYLWTFTPIIDFHDCRDIRHYKASNEHLKSFVSCINCCLLLNQSPKIENFRVVMYYKTALASDVDVWLRFLTRKNVKELDLNFSAEILSMLEEKAMPCPHSSSVCLTVDTSLCERELPGITKLLRHTPLIETLIINTTSISLHLMNSETEFLNSCDLGGENYWSSWKSTFALALLNLKTVRIIGFGATKSEVELLFFLLKNASMLGKMIIHARKTTNVSLEKSLVVAQRLLSFPRCSQDAVVIFA